MPKDNISIEVTKDVVLEKEPLKIEKEEVLVKDVSPAKIADAEKYAKEFNMPEDIKNEFLAALEGAEEVADSQDVTDEELNEAGLSLAKISETVVAPGMENITAGYSVNDKDFDEMVSACLPSGNEDSDLATLKSQALATIGLSAAAEQRYEQAEKAFTNLINNYPDEEPTQMARLEYANLLSEQGRADEAKQAVDEAITINSDDDEYVSMASNLKQRIERYE